MLLVDISRARVLFRADLRDLEDRDIGRVLDVANLTIDWELVCVWGGGGKALIKRKDNTSHLFSATTE